MTDRTWNYFNGTQHGWNSSKGYVPPKPMTAAYCADCAPAHLPGWNASAPAGREHWDTAFKCAPWRIGMPCTNCEKDI